MTIDTELVKNKRFHTPAEPGIIKHSQEYRVLATLRYLYPTKYDSLSIGEAPDLQDNKNSLGIEVTVAAEEKDMKASRAFAELRHGNPESAEKNKKIIKSTGWKLIPYNGNKLSIAITGKTCGEKKIFQKSIRKKVKKLAQYRTKFKKTGIAVILWETSPYAEAHIFEWFFEVFKETDVFFDFVYMISHRFCLYYDVQTRVLEKRFLTKKEDYSLQTIGRMTAEGELSLADKEWL